ncbi:MAG TPA: glycine zipper 2TM domain-containing protein [Dokdonella sp.]|uniref:glycine zipper 2TM domain-containing protein n=1 Tax=Dokdonella sp. TaxID=2291710 RepID=UPI002C05F752|nr:glycine zipper 2TM domain-containing protein [Dokdonella sp.]HUD43018.1 glycine zipper 2TM domain-containing protein [Dokdonella sp.]
MNLPIAIPIRLALAAAVAALAVGCTQGPASPPAGTAGADPSAPAAVADGRDEASGYARVISVTPVKRRIDHAREVCEDRAVTHRVKPKDEDRIAGTVIGGLVGGVAGNQIGDGRGRDAATVAGVVGGAIAGRKIQEHNQKRNTVTQVENVCRTVNEPTEEVYAYDVRYEYAGNVLNARLDHDPGDRIALPVRGMVE